MFSVFKNYICTCVHLRETGEHHQGAPQGFSSWYGLSRNGQSCGDGSGITLLGGEHLMWPRPLYPDPVTSLDLMCGPRLIT